jgi:3-phenylpropionate/cinnamic acid dioxygenase small subunit
MSAAISDTDIAKLLFLEARLMDEHRYQEWLSLWTDDAVYWIPCNHDDTDPMRQVSIVYDNRAKLGERVARLQSGTVLAQDPKSRMRRTVANIEIERLSEREAVVESNFVLVEARGGQQQVWCGRSIHTVRGGDGTIKIAGKKVLLVNSEQEMPLLQFLI